MAEDLTNIPLKSPAAQYTEYISYFRTKSEIWLLGTARKTFSFLVDPTLTLSPPAEVGGGNTGLQSQGEVLPLTGAETVHVDGGVC